MFFIKHRISVYPFLVLTVLGSLLLGPGASDKVMGESSVLESRILQEGTPAPVFTAEDIDGNVHDLGDTLRKKPVLIFFWSFFCGPCREELPVLQQIYSEIGEDRMAFIGINLDGNKLAKAIKKFMSDGNYQFVNLFDELDGITYKVADPYGITGTPTAYIIDLDGKIAFSSVGHLDPEKLKQIIEGILAGS
jgi:peroxiredoxin